jgi:hypothetical protein
MRFLAAASLALVVAACRIEDRTPTGSRLDEQTVRAVLTEFYQSRAARDWEVAEGLMWDSATVELHQPVAGGVWSTYHSAADYLAAAARQTRGSPPAEDVRVIRTDFRQQGPLASVWVTTRSPLPPPLAGSVVAVDHFLLRRIDGAWRIVHLVSIPDRDAAGS